MAVRLSGLSDLIGQEFEFRGSVGCFGFGTLDLGLCGEVVFASVMQQFRD